MVMTLITPLLWVLCYFLAYWFAMYVFVWIHTLSGRSDDTHPEGDALGKVLVLVPSHHEGAGLIDTVRTLIDQDYEGEIEIQVLVEDFTDSTVSALKSAYPSTEAETETLIQLATS